MQVNWNENPENTDEFYVCPNHRAQSGYESCCSCGDDDGDNYQGEGEYLGKMCTEYYEN